MGGGTRLPHLSQVRSSQKIFLLWGLGLFIPPVPAAGHVLTFSTFLFPDDLQVFQSLGDSNHQLPSHSTHLGILLEVPPPSWTSSEGCLSAAIFYPTEHFPEQSVFMSPPQKGLSILQAIYQRHVCPSPRCPQLSAPHSNPDIPQAGTHWFSEI